MTFYEDSNGTFFFLFHSVAIAPAHANDSLAFSLAFDAESVGPKKIVQS